EELAGGTFAFEPTDEDIHTAIERRVTDLAGPAGAKLHTGRSRNDQVATDLRLWCKRELAGVAGGVLGLQTVLLEHAEAAGPARWRDRRSRSIRTGRRSTSGSPLRSRTVSTPCPTGTSWPRRSSTWRCSASISRGWARSGCCGRRKSSASPTSTTPTPRGPRC